MRLDLLFADTVVAVLAERMRALAVALASFEDEELRSGSVESELDR